MKEKMPLRLEISAGHTGHIQGIAVDTENGYIYASFTTCLIKTDMSGRIVGSVRGLAGHLGCIAFNPRDGRVYGSLEYKHDSIGRGILKGSTLDDVEDGFYVALFDASSIDRVDMDAERDGVMRAVYLREVTEDYSAPEHRYGCSGIDGVTFAPAIGEDGKAEYLYVAYGIYGDDSREDNDYQVLLKYDVSDWDSYAMPLDQRSMHRSGPACPEAKYFVYTGNTTYGIQNLEYDADTGTMLAAVYRGKKERFPNYPMFFIDCTVKPRRETLLGIGGEGEALSLTDLGYGKCSSDIVGSWFSGGTTGMASLGGGLFCIAHSVRDERGDGGVLRLYRLDRENFTLELIEE